MKAFQGQKKGEVRGSLLAIVGSAHVASLGNQGIQVFFVTLSSRESFTWVIQKTTLFGVSGFQGEVIMENSPIFHHPQKRDF